MKETDFVRSWRNRQLAYNDLLLALDSDAQPPPAIGDQLEGALAAFGAVINEIQQHYWVSITQFERFAVHNPANRTHQSPAQRFTGADPSSDTQQADSICGGCRPS
jgi:hypothetical protein